MFGPDTTPSPSRSPSRSRSRSRSMIAGWLIFGSLGCAEPAAVGTDVVFVPDFVFAFDFSTSTDFSFTPAPDGPPAGGPDLTTGPETAADAEADEAVLDETVECVPQCVDRECGVDGCGDVCGLCAPGESCSAGACVGPGEVCVEPLLLHYSGQTVSVSTTLSGRTDDGACIDAGLPIGAGKADVYFRLISTRTERLIVRVISENPSQAIQFDACGSEAECLQTAAQSLEIDAVANAPILLVIEGQSAGSATISVAACAASCTPGSCALDACGTPCQCAPATLCAGGNCVPIGPGDTCNAPVAISSLPFTAPVDLKGHTDSVACAPGAERAAQVFVYTGSTDQRLRLAVSSNEGLEARAATACPGTLPQACGAAAKHSEPSGVTVALGQSLYLVAEGPLEATGSMTVSACSGCGDGCACFFGEACVNGVCEAPSGGDDCDDALVLKVGNNEHTLTLAEDDQACIDGNGAVDGVLRFTAPHAGEWGFTFESIHPLWVFQLEECGAPGSCLERALTPVTLRRTLAAGETVIWVAEVRSAGLASGLRIHIEDCAASCVAAACSKRACGRVCGCTDGATCIDDLCSQPGAGDTCATATPLPPAPSSIEGTTLGKSDTYACRALGVGTGDAVHQAVIDATGVYVATVTGEGNPFLFRPTDCVDGSARCDGGASDILFFFARQGDAVRLAVDSVSAAGAYLVSLSRVTGLAGSLGAACVDSTACSLSERCLFGVCTLACDSNLDCLGATPGPRGAAFACPKHLCAPGPSGCLPHCLPTDTGAVCTSDAGCLANQRCAAWSTLPDGGFSGVCLFRGALGESGQPCTADDGCSSHRCVGGECRALCAVDAECGPAERCLGTVEQPALGAPADIRGLCTPWAGTGQSCVANADCASGICAAAMGPDGTARRICGQSAAGAPFGFGDLCTADAQCDTGRCEFEDALAFANAYCTRPCSEGEVCPSGSGCRPLTIWDGGTPTNPTDDATVPLCLRGSAGSACLVSGANVCDSGLSCVPNPSSKLYGTCN